MSGDLSGALAPVEASVLVQQVAAIQQIMAAVMREGEHYGVIPGTNGKPTLLKSGAEKLCFAFRLRPTFEIDERSLPGGHREFLIRCRLSSDAGVIMGSGVGMASTAESKYARGGLECPACGRPKLIRSKFKEGFLVCFQKRGGCGAEIAAENAIKSAGNPADFLNTVLKMAKKRAHVDATLTALAASDCFTQDLEDERRPPPPEAPSPPPPEKTERTELLEICRLIRQVYPMVPGAHYATWLCRYDWVIEAAKGPEVSRLSDLSPIRASAMLEQLRLELDAPGGEGRVD